MVDGKWKRAAEHWRFTIFHLPFAIQECVFQHPVKGARITDQVNLREQELQVFGLEVPDQRGVG
jgi:hypothetical protein